MLALVAMVPVLFGCAFAGPARAAALPETLVVSGGSSPVVGATLTTSPAALESIDWQICAADGTLDGSAPGSDSTNSDSYALTIDNATTDVCAVEVDALGVEDAQSGPIGPVAGVAVGPTLSAAGQPVQQGQTLSVTQGQWGSGASVTDAWEDCDANGANCVAVASGATGTMYTVARSDAGDTIEVRETASAGSGGPSTSATAGPTGVASATAPSETTAPTIAGTPALGQTLTASPGAWTNQPTAYGYVWERCSSGGCTPIPGATGQTYTPTAGDVGSVLEVVVSASVFGVSGSPYPSFPTAPVTAKAGTGVTVSGSPAPQPHLRKRHQHMSSTMRWTFRYFPTYTQIVELAVENPTLGSKITMRCTGRGCPFKERRQTVARPKGCRAHGSHHCRVPRRVDLTSSFGGQDLAAGAAVTVLIKRSGYIGQDYRFEIRARKQPAVRIGCLEPGSSRVRASCR